MNIAGYIKTSLIEWPGKVSSVIFVLGCNFRCPFCHNADLVEDKVERSTRINEKQILTDLEKRKKWIDGIVVTGGEPTLQVDLPKFLKLLKSLKLEIMVHTNGSRPEVVEKLIKEKLVDYWAMDIKGDLKNYSNYTNCSNVQTIEGVQESLRLIVNSGVEYELRTTVVPGLHDQKNLICLAEQIKFLVQSSKACPESIEGFKVQSCRWFLQQFRPMNCYDKKYLEIKPFSKQQMEMFLEEIQKIVPQTLLRGI